MTEKEAKTITATLERYLSQSKNRTDRDNITKAILAIGNLQIYQRIGDFEEFKVLKEKSELKKPIHYDKHYYKCPVCNEELGVNDDSIYIYEDELPNFCSKCGQKLAWKRKGESSC